MVTPDKIFSPAQRERLARAAAERFSCRAFAGELSMADRAALLYLIGRYTLPGVRLALCPADDALFTGASRITGCHAVLAVYINRNVSHVQINAGFAGEALCLELTAMGLAGCWLTDTFRRTELEAAARLGEELPAVIAVGRPAVSGDPDRPRKPVERLCRGDIAQWPEAYRRAAALVRLAPSAMNLQPWELFIQDGCLCLDGTDRARLDLGIALCHAELGLTMPHAWTYGLIRTEPMLCAVLK